MVHCINWGVKGHTFQKNISFLYLKIDIVLADSADLDEMPHPGVFHQGLYNTLSTRLGVFRSLKKVKFTEQ